MSKDMSAKLKRLRFILDSLDNKRDIGEVVMSDIMEKFNVSRRTALRDIESLKNVGITFYERTYGYVFANLNILKQAKLSSQFAAALCLMYEVAERGGEEFEPLRQEILQQFYYKRNSFEINPLLDSTDTIDKLRLAILNDKPVAIISKSGRKKTITPRFLIKVDDKVDLVFLINAQMDSCPVELITKVEIISDNSTDEKANSDVENSEATNKNDMKHLLFKYLDKNINKFSRQ